MCELERDVSELDSLRTQLAKANEDYKTLFSAFESCQGELKKANERVKELEKELKESEDDLDAAEQQLSNYENALEEVQAVFVDSDACPLFEPFNPKNLSAWLNKFAIEKKTEVIAHILRSYKTKKFYPTNYAIQAFNDGVAHLWAHIECCELQLRKEQE